MKKHEFLRQRVFHDGMSMIVAKAGESHAVPDDQVADFIADETIVDPNPPKRRKAPEDGEGGGDPAFASKHVGGGRFEITGPGLAEPERVQGKEAAEARLAELEAAHDADGGAPTD